MSIRYCDVKYFPKSGEPPSEGITLIQKFKRILNVSVNRDIIAGDSVLRNKYMRGGVRTPAIIESECNGLCLMFPFDTFDDIVDGLPKVKELCRDTKVLHVKEFRNDPEYKLTKILDEMPMVVNYYINPDIPSVAKEYLHGFKGFNLPVGMSESLEWSIVDNYSELLRFDGYIHMASTRKIKKELPKDVYQFFIDSEQEGMPSEEAFKEAVRKCVIL